MKYQIIYCDPPWQFNNKKTGGSMKSGAANKYKVESIKDLMNIDINSIADENCALLMWYVSAMPQEAIDLVNAWGFTLKNMNGFVWNKKTKKGLPHFGMGFYTRAGSESMIIATKGKIKPVSHSVRSVVEHTTLSHSEKPDIFKTKIVDLFGDLKKIELFARKETEGWDVFGDEVKNSIKINRCTQ